jgi:hypothetical protein
MGACHLTQANLQLLHCNCYLPVTVPSVHKAYFISSFCYQKEYMSDSIWASSSASSDNQGDDMNSTGKQIHIYVDEQLRQSFSVCKTLPHKKQKGQIYATLSDTLFDDHGDTDILLDSVRITTTPEAKPVAVDELQKYARNDDIFTITLSKLLAINTQSQITLWFITLACQARDSQEALHPPKRMKNSDKQKAVPLDQQFVHELATEIAKYVFCADLFHSRICVQLCTCVSTYILWPNVQYCEIAKKYVALITLNTSPRHCVDFSHNCRAEHLRHTELTGRSDS